MKPIRMTMLSRSLALVAILCALCTLGTQPLAAQAVKSVAVTCTSVSLTLGGRSTCSARARLANGQFTTNKPTTWYSSNGKVAIVSEKGIVSTIGTGDATITAGISGQSGSALVTVASSNPSPPPPPIVTAASLTVTLGKTSIPVGQTTQATAVPRDSSGNVLTNRAVTWNSTTPGIATVTGAGLVTAVAAGTATIRASVDAKTFDATLTVSAAPAAPVNDTSKAGAVLRFAGPTIAAASVPMSAAFYETNFRTATDAQWTTFGPQWDPGNSISGYERAAIYYVWWARTGDTTYLSRAHQTAVNYRDNYLIPANYATSPHWSQMESLYLDWIVTGDTKSRDAVLNVGNVWIAFLLRSSGGQSYLTTQAEGRQRARIMISEWMVEKLTGTRNQWLDSAIVQTLATLNTQGFAPDASTCGGSLNYMGGMVMDALTRLHDQRANNWNAAYNTAIETKALAFGSYLWSTQWRGAADPSFNYVSLLCDGTGSPTSAPDLNGLILPTFGWLGKQTGNAMWFARGDSVLAGMQGAYLDGYRQTSESYSSSFRYFGYRYPDLVITSAASPTQRVRRP